MEDTQTNTTGKESLGSNSKKWIFIAVAVIIIVVVAAIGGLYLMDSNSESTEGDAMTEEDGAMMEAEEDSMMMEEDEAEDETSYIDGTYTATGEYKFPKGTELIEITLTLESGVITESVAVSKAVDPISKRMQADFIENYEAEVIGKDIDDVELSVVSGSSLTSGGFNAAVEDIKQQAAS